MTMFTFNKEHLCFITNLIIIVCVLLYISCSETTDQKIISIHLNVLKDKIKGGWAGQTIGCTFGGPTEFKFQGTFIHDYQPIPWYDGYIKDTYINRPGLYDDIYMDLTFVHIYATQGLDAPAKAFSEAFANAKYPLWHANQMARYNILHGVLPPESGLWLNNPHADDIDFQIEADFAGLMCPCMVNTSAEICDKVGHIMNYGDGWYGGVYIAAMYALAFVSNDINYIVEEALKVIPEKSQYAQVMRDVIRWHHENPDDWKATWFKVQRKWSEDVGCPVGVFNSFNIDAKINSAWILLSLLYGEGDFGKTLSISTRAGDDSDCNPASAGGILGTMLGYEKIPTYWKQGLKEVESRDFKYTTLSLKRAYELSFKNAQEMIQSKGGFIYDSTATIRFEKPKPVKLEIGFEGHYPIEKRGLNVRFQDTFSFEFEGIGFAVRGNAETTDIQDYVLKVKVMIDGKQVEITELPTSFLLRKETPFRKYQMEKGIHKVDLYILNPSKSAAILIKELVIYNDSPLETKY